MVPRPVGRSTLQNGSQPGKGASFGPRNSRAAFQAPEASHRGPRWGSPTGQPRKRAPVRAEIPAQQPGAGVGAGVTTNALPSSLPLSRSLRKVSCGKVCCQPSRGTIPAPAAGGAPGSCRLPGSRPLAACSPSPLAQCPALLPPCAPSPGILARWGSVQAMTLFCNRL